MISYKSYIVSYLSSGSIFINLKAYSDVKDYNSIHIICLMFLYNIRFFIAMTMIS